jgi:hypothetical protein
MRTQIRAAALAAALLVGLAACGSSGPKGDADTKGQRAQAIDELHRYGLTEDQAACMADRLGPATVVAASDMAALAAGQPYQDAAKECISGS